MKMKILELIFRHCYNKNIHLLYSIVFFMINLEIRLTIQNAMNWLI